MLTLSLSSSRPLSLYGDRSLFLKSLAHGSRFLHPPQHSTFLPLSPFGVSSDCKEMMTMEERKKKKNKRRGGFGPVCYSAPLTPHNLQWISTVSTSILVLARGTAIQKSFLVPLFALQAPPSIISWIKGEYGIWTAFLALLVRLYFFIPGELELPFIALLLVIVAPYEVMNLRGTQGGVILALVIAGYLAFQHFSWAGSLRKAFDHGSVVATLAIICAFAVPCLLLI